MASAAFSSNAPLFKSSIAVRGRTTRLVSVKTHKSSLAVERFQSIPSNLTPLISRRRGFESHCLTSPGAAQVEPPPEDDREEKEEENVDMVSAIPLVEGFYNSINTRNVEALSEFLAENCVLNDLQFPKAFEGRQVVLKFFEDLMEAMGKGMKFKIDDKSEGEAFTVAVLWHLEWEGKALPFTKGCSFYRCEKEGDRMLIRFVQGFIEPPIKPGEMVLQILKMVSSLFEQFPLIAKRFLANPYYMFGESVAIYRKYLRPIMWPIINPFIIYYRTVIKTFFYWIGFLLSITLRVMNLILK